MHTIPAQEIIRRRDMREVLTFTIDPADAKDFDDALSFVRLDDGTMQIGVHIADVTHYVHPDSDIDRDAYNRGTSIYLVDRVIPMLPEELCNDLCSLREDEDKLCMSVVFTMNGNAEVLKHKICRTVIRSNKRLSYEQAQALLDNPHADIGGSVPEGLAEALAQLNTLAKTLRQQRFAAGALNIEQDEIRFRLDEHQHPVEIWFAQPMEANHLIEEFMLLANRTVARTVSERHGSRGQAPAFVYRVHDKPDDEKLEALHTFEKRLRRLPDNATASNVIEMLTIRAMAKAVYSTHNIGHYGLAFSHYTHFTSPIRRYPDMMVHRLVDKYILTGKAESLSKEQLQEACEHCSQREQEAQQAERDSVKFFQALWIQDHLGEEFDGHISGVTEFGVFVRLDASRTEGLIHITKLLPDDYMLYDEKNFRLVAQRSNRTFTLGDPIRVRVVRSDPDRLQIDFLPAELVENK